MFRMLLLSSVLLLGACSTHLRDGPVSSNMSVHSNASNGTKSIGVNVAKIIENTYYRLPTEAAHKHTETVYFVINNLHDGELMRWYDKPSGTSGSVKVLMTNTYGGSYCRLVNSQVIYSDKTRNLNEYACSNDSGESWTFRPYNG